MIRVELVEVVGNCHLVHLVVFVGTNFNEVGFSTQTIFALVECVRARLVNYNLVFPNKHESIPISFNHPAFKVKHATFGGVSLNKFDSRQMHVFRDPISEIA